MTVGEVGVELNPGGQAYVEPGEAFAATCVGEAFAATCVGDTVAVAQFIWMPGVSGTAPGAARNGEGPA